jgi:DNA polymerase III delta subunit
MTFMDVNVFEREIVSPQRKPFYLIAGGDPSAVSRCLEAARRAVSPALFELNYRQYGLEELIKFPGRFEGDLLANPMGKPPKIVVLALDPNDKLKAENLAFLSALKPKISRNVTLLLVVNGTIDNRLKFFKEISQAGLIIDCQAPTIYNLPNWLIGKFKEKGLRLGREAAALMIDRAGTSLGVLLSEIEKLAIHPGPSVVISTEHIRTLVSLSSTARIVELSSPLAKGRLDKALPIMTDLLETASPVGIIMVLASHFEQLFRLKVVMEASGGQAPDALLCAESGLAPNQIKYYREEIAFWSLATISQAHSVIQDYLRSVLAGQSPGPVTLSALAIKLASLAKKERTEYE